MYSIGLITAVATVGLVIGMFMIVCYEAKKY